MYEDPKSKISQLEKVLDAREDRVSSKVKRHELHEQSVNVNEDWDNSEFKVGAEISTAEETPAKISPISFKILIGSIIFFVVAILVVAYNFIAGGNMVSGNNINITVKAPISISGGSVVSFELEIKNNNNITLAGADLGITFPVGAMEASNTALPAKRVQDFIGNILPGQTIKKNYSIVLVGTENEKKDININLEYKVAGSNSFFNKTKVISILISSAPVSIVVTGPNEVNTNQNVDLTAEITSNSPTVIKNLLLKVDYPFGFIFANSNPKTFSKNNLWLIGDLEPGAKRVIKFSGMLSGQEGEERVFNFSLGSQAKSDSLTIDVPYSTSLSAVTIRRPFVSADLYFNGSDSTDFVSAAGSKIEAVIKWKNNLAYEVNNVSIMVNINGNTVNKATISADGGYYKSINNTITFNKTTDITLASLAPGQEGESKFEFSSFGAGTVTGSGLVNPTIVLDYSVSGQRVDFQAGQENILFTDTRKIKITSNPRLFAKALHYTGPFQNTGPMPPRAEQETFYTVTWTITNPLNNLSGAQVSAVLPPYVKWLSAISPNKEQLDYDPGTGRIIWNVGAVLAGAGTVTPAREVSFQISFLPSVDQIGEAPGLVSEASLTAKDAYTGTAVSSLFPILNTRLSSDPYFKTEAETVIR